MFGEKILDGVAVRYHIPAETELPAQACRQPVIAALDREPVVIVVRTHDSEDAGLLDDPLPGIYMDHLDFAR